MRCADCGQEWCDVATSANGDAADPKYRSSIPARVACMERTLIRERAINTAMRIEASRWMSDAAEAILAAGDAEANR